MPSAEIKRSNSSVSNTRISCTETFLCIVQPPNDAPAVFSLHAPVFQCSSFSALKSVMCWLATPKLQHIKFFIWELFETHKTMWEKQGRSCRNQENKNKIKGSHNMTTVISQTRAQCGDNVQLFHMKLNNRKSMLWIYMQNLNKTVKIINYIKKQCSVCFFKCFIERIK